MGLAILLIKQRYLPCKTDNLISIPGVTVKGESLPLDVDHGHVWHGTQTPTLTCTQ